MTDPTLPETDLGEIVVTGQRARGPSPFADLQYPTKGAGSGGGEQQEEVGDGGLGGGGDLSDEQEQCGDPEGRRQWNADARAQRAIEEFRARARLLGEPDLQNREFGALLCDMGNGNIALGPIEVGAPFWMRVVSRSPILAGDRRWAFRRPDAGPGLSSALYIRIRGAARICLPATTSTTRTGIPTITMRRTTSGFM
jgi:hypothetical protein